MDFNKEIGVFPKSCPRKSLYIGLMSGTSMDGIDAALLNIDNHQLVAAHTSLYEPELAASLKSLMSSAAKAEIGLVYQTNRLVGEAFAKAANELIIKTRIDRKDIKAIGSHGQTIIHAPLALPPYTVQLGCPYTIALRTGLTVVADFRTKDLILGGQGAPLAPLYHQEVFKKLAKPLAIVNIGGIANITFLLPGNIYSQQLGFRRGANERAEGVYTQYTTSSERVCNKAENHALCEGRGSSAKSIVRGYDVGPGNCIIDAYAHKHLGTSYDKNGALAASGKVVDNLLTTLLQDPFFSRPAPKSLDKAYFALEKINHLFAKNLSIENIQATLTAFTAHAIALAIKKENIALKHILVCGGGVHNLYLMNVLQSLLVETKIESSAQYDISPDYVEAMMCAWLAHMRIQKKTLVLKNITGGGTTLLGSIYL